MTRQVSPAGRLTLHNVSLHYCLVWAYDVRDYHISAPEWLISERYEIQAEAGHPEPESTLRLMLQNLLADRFALTLHHETRDIPFYALVPDKSGPKLRPTQSTEPPAVGHDPAGHMAMIYANTTMAGLADAFGPPFTDRPIVDKTNLTGAFDFTLNLDPYMEFDEKHIALTDAAIKAVLPAQLGLKLEPIKAPIEMLIVDKVNRNPTAN
jgi:uncharacterized protein (TIGR03435 family)